MGQGNMTAFTSPPIPASRLRGVRRAELLFSGVEQAGPSFEGRVFLNNPDADESTPQAPQAGYAGSFHVYGYGEAAPPAMAEARARQGRGGRAVAPIDKRLDPNAAALRAALDRSDELTVTVVPVPADPGGATPQRPFERVEVIVDPAASEQ